jgi:hypothetical protein
VVLVAEAGDRGPLDQLHHEVRPARRRARVKDLGDVRMIHQRQGLALGLEAGDDLLGVHAGLDELQGHQPLDRLGLLSHEHRAHAAFAYPFQQLVGADDGTGALGGRLIDGGRWILCGRFEETTRVGNGPEQALHAPPQFRVAATNLVQVAVAVLTRGTAKGLVKNLIDGWSVLGHGHVPQRLSQGSARVRDDLPHPRWIFSYPCSSWSAAKRKALA